MIEAAGGAVTTVGVGSEETMASARSTTNPFSSKPARVRPLSVNVKSRILPLPSSVV
jgi:hypothetical protein